MSVFNGPIHTSAGFYLLSFRAPCLIPRIVPLRLRGGVFLYRRDLHVAADEDIPEPEPRGNVFYIGIGDRNAVNRGDVKRLVAESVNVMAMRVPVRRDLHFPVDRLLAASRKRRSISLDFSCSRRRSGKLSANCSTVLPT